MIFYWICRPAKDRAPIGPPARLWRDQSGIFSVAFAVLPAFVSTGIITVATGLGDAIENGMEDTASGIETGTTGCNQAGAGPRPTRSPEAGCAAAAGAARRPARGSRAGEISSGLNSPLTKSFLDEVGLV